MDKRVDESSTVPIVAASSICIEHKEASNRSEVPSKRAMIPTQLMPSLMSFHKELRPTQHSESLIRIIGSNVEECCSNTASLEQRASEKSGEGKSQSEHSTCFSSTDMSTSTSSPAKMQLRHRRDRPNYSLDQATVDSQESDVLIPSYAPPTTKKQVHPPPLEKSSKGVRRVKAALDGSFQSSMLLATAAPSPGPKTTETKGFKTRKAGHPAKVNPPATVSSQDSKHPPRKISLTSAKLPKKTSRKRRKNSNGPKLSPPKRKRTKASSLGSNPTGFRGSKTACLGLSNYSMCGTCRSCQVLHDCGTCFQCVRRAVVPPEYRGLMLCVQRICATPLHLSTTVRPTKKLVAPQQQPDVPTHHRPDPPCSPSATSKMEPEGLRTPTKLAFGSTSQRSGTTSVNGSSVGPKRSVPAKQLQFCVRPDPPAS